MRKHFFSILMLCAAVVSFVLAGCGSGDVTTTPSVSPTVTGVAASGAPVDGVVTLKDSSVPAKIKKVKTNTDGYYLFDVRDLKPPFIIKVEWLENMTDKRLYSLAKRASKANINPFSDAAVAGSTSDGDPDGLYDRGDPAEIEATAARIRAVIDGLKTVLTPLFELYQTSQDPVSGDFEANHTGLDALFDDVRIYVASGKVFVVNKRTKLLIFEAPVTNIASGTFYPENMPGVPGTIDGAALYADNCSGCHGPLATSDKAGATAASIHTAIQNNAGGMGTLASLTALQIQAIASALATGTPPPPPPAVCTYTYSAWGACQPDGTQTRTMLTSSPAGCTGTPILTQTCTYVPPPTACTYTYSAWGACQSNNTQTRTMLTSSPAGCTGTPILTQTCTYVPPPTACTYTYSAWGACQSNNTQTRTVLASSPAGCTGTPILTQTCTYVPPIDGAALYTQYCSGCHGNSKKGKSVTAIQSAIDSNRGGMGSLSFLTPEQIAAISSAP